MKLLAKETVRIERCSCRTSGLPASRFAFTGRRRLSSESRERKFRREEEEKREGTLAVECAVVRAKKENRPHVTPR